MTKNESIPTKDDSERKPSRIGSLVGRWLLLAFPLCFFLWAGELGMGATCNLTATYSRADTKGFSASYVHGQLDIAVAQITEDMGVPGDYAFPALEKDRGKGVDPKFAHAIKHKTATCRGGDPKLREAKKYFAWLNSTAYEPAPIPRAARLVPNYVLVAGSDPALGAAFKAATEHYINKQAKL